MNKHHFAERESLAVKRVTLKLEPITSKKRLPRLVEQEIIDELVKFFKKEVKSGNESARFLLGQLYFDQEEYTKAYKQFSKAPKADLQSLYQMAIMTYDGLGIIENPQRGLALLADIAHSDAPETKHLKGYVQYNIGLAYYQGFGIDQSDENAASWWELAGNGDCHDECTVKAQTMLGMFFCRKECLNLDKALYWHEIANKNGSLESQGALGVMYLYGIGVAKNYKMAHQFLYDASARGNVYAIGSLSVFYYSKMMYIKAGDVASKIIGLTDIDYLAYETGCINGYISKGIAMACFVFSQCLLKGLGMPKDVDESKKYLSKAFEFDSDVTAKYMEFLTHNQNFLDMNK